MTQKGITLTLLVVFTSLWTMDVRAQPLSPAQQCDQLHQLIGTDTLSSGYNVHQELALFVEAGLTPYQALRAGTVEPARYFQKEGEFGTIVKGASADFVLLDANPLDDIANALKISGVMVRGHWLGTEKSSR